jgi:peptidoglycan/LPS O-acetylase OafA/YrhL
MQKHKNLDLDAIRWISAFMVVVGHARGMLMPDPDSVSMGPAQKVFYLLTGFPNEAVIVFFLLSGYLVGGGAIAKVRRGSFDVASYALARFSRIYLVLVPALLLTLILDVIGIGFFNSSGIYSDSKTFHELTQGSFEDRLTVGNFFGNLLNLQQVEMPVFGSNSPLWSLAYEWWSYVFFGVACWVIQTRRRSAMLVAAVLVALAVFVFAPKFGIYFGIWLAGAGAAAPPKPNRGAWAAPAFLALGAVVLVSRVARDTSTEVLFDIAIGAVGAVFLWLKPTSSLLKSHVHETLAGFSYSLYLIHYPLVVLAAGLVDSVWDINHATSGMGSTFIATCIVVALIVATSWAFAQATERHTNKFRSWLTGRLGRSPRRARTS